MSTPRPEPVTLDDATCHQLVAQHHFGRVSVSPGEGGAPIVLPVNYTFHDDMVWFRTSEGVKLDAARRGAPAAFQVDAVDEARRQGWSVLARGVLEEITDPDDSRAAEQLPIDPFAGGDREHVLRLRVEELTGRRLPFPEKVPDEWFEAADIGHVWHGQDASDLMG